MINIELIYPLPNEQELFTIMVEPDTSVGAAIEQSNIRLKYPEIDLTINKVGIFGKACKLDKILEAGDRIEIYRPLIAEPKAVRKQKADQQKAEQQK